MLYVDQCEDERTLADTSNAARSNQVNFIQSYVLDLKVNELLRRKGFDMEPIDGDQAIAMNNQALLLESGFSPPSKREAVFGALQFAEQIVEQERGNRPGLVRNDDALAKLRMFEPEIYRLATKMAETVFEYGTDSKDAIRNAIDTCLVAAFEYTGDPLELEKDLIVPPDDEPNFDKWPDWIPGANVRSKCQVGRVMALHDIPDDCKWFLSCERITGASLSFELSDGSVVGPWRISTPYSVWNLHQMKELDMMNKVASNRHSKLIEEAMKRNRENQERRQATIDAMTGRTAPNPPAPPHLPSPRLPFPPQIPGRRPYMAGLGRFLTEARLAERPAGEHPYAYANNNPTTYIDPSGLQPTSIMLYQLGLPITDFAGRPILPPGESYVRNCCEAMKNPYLLGLLWFRNKVRNKGDWDYKQQGRPFEGAGNFHFGFMAACAGIPLNFALKQAGRAQVGAGTSREEWQKGGPPYGDDPTDQAWIRGGYANAMRWMNELRRKCGLCTMEGGFQNFREWRDNEIDRILKEGAEPPRHWWR